MMLPEAHWNFCHKVFSLVSWFYFIPRLENTELLLLNAVPAFLALPLFSLILFPISTTLPSPSLLCPSFYLMHHSSQLSASFSGSLLGAAALLEFLSSRCLALVCTHTHFPWSLSANVASTAGQEGGEQHPHTLHQTLGEFHEMFMCRAWPWAGLGWQLCTNIRQ